MTPQLIKTDDGSHTIFVPDLDEHYHSTNGAITESMHVFLNSAYRTSQANPANILEIGFGTGLNALLTMVEADKTKRKTTFYSIELFPITKEQKEVLNYPQQINADKALFQKLHDTPWNQKVEISEYFTLYKINADLLTYPFLEEPSFDIVYFDAFGPDKQPKLWEESIFEKIAKKMNPDAILSTYSAKGSVRRTMQKVGLEVKRQPGPPGKREMLVARKPSNRN